VEAQVRRTPDAVALAVGGESLTYRELNRRANRLAHRLRGLGVRPEVRVAVAAERSAATLVALLAVLKAGGAYVPVDPQQTPARLRALLEDAAPALLLVSDARRASFPRVGQLALSPDEGACTANGGEGDPAPLARPDNVAQVLYASSARPAGVLVPHRQLVHLTIALWACEQPPLAYAVWAPLSLGAAAAAIYWTLSQGGRLVLPGDDSAEDPDRVARVVEEQRVTHLGIGARLYAALLERGGDTLRSLREITLTGEPVPPRLVLQHQRVLPHARLCDDSGSGDAGAFSTSFVCRAGWDEPGHPVGRPIPGAQVHLLDDQLRPVPAGAIGELYLAGVAATRGYWNGPATTAERFLPNPHALQPGERLYRSGERARRLADGAFELLGRGEPAAEVEVGGLRVELREIEAQLARHPEVSAASVRARTDRGQTRLVAYLVPCADATLACETLVGFLREKVPDYMIPSLFVFLDELPTASAAR
jgi:amino acid adenylation domain-containing protein